MTPPRGSWALLSLLACTSQGVQGPAPATSAPPDELRCDKKPTLECFLRIPAGSFLMGAQSSDPAGPGYDPDAAPNEGPPRTVTLAEYWIQRHEAPAYTVNRCLTSETCPRDQVRADSAYSNIGPPERAEQPANTISWAGAAAACAAIGGRLPTEAEWEYAARGPNPRRYPWGDKPGCGVPAKVGLAELGGSEAGSSRMMRERCELAGTIKCDDATGPSPFSVIGMAGNVAEWVADAWAPYPGSSEPAGDTARRVQRGGGWMSTDPLELRSTARTPAAADEQLPDVGFRCVWGRVL